MARFHPRPDGRALSSRKGKLLVLGTSIAILVGLSVLVTGGLAQSSDGSRDAGAAAKKKRTFVRACVQRHDVKHSQGDLNVLKSECEKGQRPLRLALWPVKRKAGKQGPQGPQGAQGPTGPQGPKGAQGAPATTESGVASVFVDRGAAGGPTRFGSYAVPIGSTVGSTASGHFRFSCSQAQEPCRISIGAAVISSTSSSNAFFYPRLLIQKEDNPGAPMTFCEYADGSNNTVPIAQIPRVPTLAAALTSTTTKRNMGIGGTFDCGSGQTGSTTVTEIEVPASANGTSTAFYDVWPSFGFAATESGIPPGSIGP